MHAKVLVVGTSRKTRGGITSVIKAHESGRQWKAFHCHWIQTHRDGPAWRKILYMGSSLLDFIIRLPFYDIVHIHFSLTQSAKRKVIFQRIAKSFNKKVIIHLHCGSQIKEIWSPVYDEMFRNADLAILLSKNLMNEVKKYSPETRMRVLYNPCPEVKKIPCAKTKIILFSGTLNQNKGFMDLIEAFAKISDKYPDWRLVLAGNGELEKGKNRVQELGITDKTDFLGWVRGEEKERAFQSASIFCLPSYAEGFPMAVLDAWAYGLPVITTPVGGIPDIAKEGDNMLLFSPGDIDILAKKLELLIKNEALRYRLSDESRKLAATTFNIDSVNAELGKLYTAVL